MQRGGIAASNSLIIKVIKHIKIRGVIKITKIQSLNNKKNNNLNHQARGLKKRINLIISKLVGYLIPNHLLKLIKLILIQDVDK